MSGLTLWTMDKTVMLTGERRHHHKGPPVAPGFIEPALVPQIQFGPTALAASIARTATLRAAPPEVVARMATSVLGQAEMLIEEGPDFTLSPHLQAFADTEITTFSGRVGAGITDLYMNALHYAWRDNAACLSSSLDPHADFLYHGGQASGHGVVLAEARGSFAAKVSDARMAYEAQRKYMRQVRPYIGMTSLHGPVIHGYALAFGAHAASGACFLRLSQTRRPTLGTSNSSGQPPHSDTPFEEPSGMAEVPAPIALACYRSNFILMDALPVANWIDWLEGRRDLPVDIEPVSFFRFEYGGRNFVASLNAFIAHEPFYWRMRGLPEIAFRTHSGRSHWSGSPRLNLFAMEESAAEHFLDGLSQAIGFGERGRLGSFRLPRGDIEGFSMAKGESLRPERPGYDYALFRDGLALIARSPKLKFTGFRNWHPKTGLH